MGTVPAPSRIHRLLVIMGSVLTGCLVGLAIAAKPAMADVPNTDVLVGSIPGQFSVDQGTASYTIPIELPPGISGMQPELSLAYNSNAGNGIAGIGWSLGGLSAIARCGWTYAQDGALHAVDYSPMDRFCMDGQRLIAIDGSYGADGTEYRTELESYSKIISHGAAGSGPEWFEVHTKSGQRIEYGNTPDSRVEAQGRQDVRQWSVSAISDVKGNNISFEYDEDETLGSHHIDRLIYSTVIVDLEYEDRPDKFVGYAAGSKLSMPVRLSRILVAEQSNPVSEYRLTYKADSPLKKSQLAAVTRCDGSQQCFAPVSIGWTAGLEMFAAPTRWFHSSNNYANQPSWGQGEYTDLIDMNNDGLPDRVAHYDYDNGGGAGLWVALNTGSGFDQPSRWFGVYYASANRPSWGHENTLLADVNGDGLPDRLGNYDYQTGQGHALWVSLNTGSSFADQEQWFKSGILEANKPNWASGNYVSLVDMDGDGRPDRVAHYDYDPGGGFGLWVWRNTGSSFETTPTLWFQSVRNEANRPFWGGGEYTTLIDMNGDGLPDRVAYYDYDHGGGYGLWVSLNTGSRFEAVPTRWFHSDTVNANRPRWGNGQYTDLIDMNGDGLPDRVAHRDYDHGGGSGLWVTLNTGAGFEELPTLWFQSVNAYANEPSWALENTALVDVNGDGLPDRVGHYDYDTGQGYALWVSLNTGSGFENPVKWFESNKVEANKPRWGKGDYTNIVDVDGDGLPDRLGHHDYDDGGGFGFWVARNLGARPLVASVTDGLGSVINVEYTTIVDPDVYEKGGDSLYPLRSVQGSMYVVRRVTKSDGIGGESATTYRYGGARADIRGRGFLGFAWDEIADEATGITTRTEYHQEYPKTGMPTRMETLLSDGRIVSESTISYDTITAGYTDTLPTPDGGSRTQNYTVHFPYLSHKVEKIYELDGSLVSTVTTRHEDYDDYGNVGSVTVSTSASGETYEKVTDSTYDNDEVKWHLGRLRTATVTHIHADGRTETRTSGFDYDPDSGLLWKERIEPGQPAYTQITTYEYDAFGNKIRATISGDGVSGRTTTSGYDPTGRFATSISNALGHAEERYFDRYPHCGTADRLTGPNGLTTRWEYDNFCRKELEVRADGTETVWARDWADPANDEHAPADAVYYVQEKSSGTPAVTKYYDVLGRAIRAVSTGFDGRAVYQDTVYDAQGREFKSSLPYYAGDISYWVENEYDILNRVTRKVFHTGKQIVTTTYSYDGLTTTETNTLGQSKTTTKNALGKVVRVDEEEGAYVLYEYDPVGNLTHTHQGDSTTGQLVTTRVGYDLRGHKIWMQDPDMSAASCDPEGGVLAGCWQYQYNVFGELISQTDAKGQTVSMTYDALGRMETRSEPEGITTWIYDDGPMAIGELSVVDQRDTEGNLLVRQESEYEGYGRPRMTKTIIPNDAGTLNEFTSWVYYDLYGRVDYTIQPGGFELRNSYDPNTGYLVAKQSPLPQVGDYDSAHLADLFDDAVTSAQAAIAKADWYASQAAYFESKADYYTGVIAAQAQTQELAAGAPALDDPRGYLTYTDASGVLYAETSPTVVIIHGSVATPILVAPEQHYQLIQDSGGQWAVSVIDHASWAALKPSLTADGNKLHIGDFDANGARDFRLVAADSSDPLFDNTTLSKLGSLTADIREAGRILANRADNAIALAQQLIIAAANVRDRERQAQYWTSADGSELNQMTADADAGMVTWWRATARDAAGRLAAHRLGNGLLELRDYDPANGQLNSIQTGFGYGAANMLRHLDYEYDALDNVTARYDEIQNVREEFEYDRLNRLTSARVAGYTAGVSYESTVTYAYDALGNMTHKSDVGDYLYGDGFKANGAWAGPHAILRTGFTDDYIYDANGSITQSNGRNITWTSFNKPHSFDKAGTVVKFFYGPDRARYKKTVGGEIGVDRTTLYVGNAYERIEDASGRVTHKYFVHTEDGLTAIHVKHEDASGQIDGALDETRYLHRDALGSIDTITDGQGNIIERTSYSPFGARRGGDWHTLGGLTLDLYTNRGFTGHEHIEEMGLIHMNGRVYDPEIGRFLSADPHVQAPTASQSYNRYSYVMNNPLKYTDPSGYFLKKLFKAVKKFVNKALDTFRSIMRNPYVQMAITAVATFLCGPPCAAAANFQHALWNGGSLGDAFKAGLDTLAYSYLGAVGAGLYAEARGRKFIHGFGASLVNAAGRHAPNLGPVGNVVARVVIAGTASEVGGGKFANGAATFAFSYAVTAGYVTFQDGGAANDPIYDSQQDWMVPEDQWPAIIDGMPTLSETSASDSLTWGERALLGLREYFGVGSTSSARVGIGGATGGAVASGGAAVLNVDTANAVVQKTMRANSNLFLKETRNIEAWVQLESIRRGGTPSEMRDFMRQHGVRYRTTAEILGRD